MKDASQTPSMDSWALNMGPYEVEEFARNFSSLVVVAALENMDSLVVDRNLGPLVVDKNLGPLEAVAFTY